MTSFEGIVSKLYLQLHNEDDSRIHVIYISNVNEILMREFLHDVHFMEDIFAFRLSNLDELCCICRTVFFLDSFMYNAKLTPLKNKEMNYNKAVESCSSGIANAVLALAMCCKDVNIHIIQELCKSVGYYRIDIE